MPRVPRPHWFTFPLVMILACSRGPDTRYDQVPPGIDIVTNPARPEAPAEFVLAAEPTLRVGGPATRPEDELEPSMGSLTVVPLGDGGMMVTEEARIHFFDAKGVRRALLGRRGSGPGEFLGISAACGTRGDTVVVEDYNNARITVIDAKSATVVRTFSNKLGHMTRQSCFGDGSLLFEGVEFDKATRALDFAYRRVRLDGSVVGLMKVVHRSRDRIRQVGTPSVAVSGLHWYYADPYFSEIRLLDPTGLLARVIRSDDPLDEIPQKDADAARGFEAAKGNVVTPDLRGKMSRRPFFSRVAADPDGRAWLRDPDDPRAEFEVWTGFDSTGHLRGRLRIKQPPLGQKFYVLGFTSGGVLMRRGDPNGDAFIELYPLVPARDRESKTP